MKVPKYPRYNRTFSSVYEFLSNTKSSELPFNPYLFIKKHNWALMTYEELADKTKITPKKVRKSFRNSPGISIYNGNNFTIAYDSTEYSRRIIFTLTHEIAHILLNHHIDFEETCFERGFTKPEYKVLETEADVFAKNILAPLHIVLALQTKRLDLYTLFNLSWDAAGIRNKTTHLDEEFLSLNQLNNLYSKHKSFIDSVKNYNKCYCCGNIFLKETDIFCPICSHINISKSLKSKEVFTMFYKKIELDDDFKLTKCLRCDNEEFGKGDRYCKICGAHIINACSERQCSRYELDGNARYCPECGARTTFYSANFLPSWVEEKENSFGTIKKEDDESIPEDDWPF